MTNKERLFEVFRNEPTDRVPVGFWFHFLPEPRVDALTDAHLPEESFQGHKRFIEAFHPDFVKVMSDGFFGYPGVTPDLIKQPEDLLKLVTVTKDHPWIKEQVEIIRRVTALQSDTAYFYNIFSPSTIVRMFLGTEKYLEWLKASPEKFSAGLNKLAEGIVFQVRSAVTDGQVDGIYFSVQNPDIKAISDEEYRKYITPSDQAVLDAANSVSKNNILHVCGYEGVKNRLDFWRDYKATAYNWAVNVEGVSLAEGKKLFGNKAVIGGFANTSGSLIHKGSKEKIQQFVRDLIQSAGKTGVVIGADCTVPSDIDLTHLTWVREAAENL
jgi:uroporphyrinogen decarboxylase